MIRSVGTDRNPSTRKHMEAHEPGLDDFFDIWHISKNTNAYSQMKTINSDKRLLKNITQMSPQGENLALVAFHSVLIDFAAKSQAFSAGGFLEAQDLQSCSSKKNSARSQAVTKKGKPWWSAVTSKARKGHFTARPEPTEPTYVYVRKLVKEVTESSSK
ncbi:conserved hypothetical protein [Ixodes scapularis]|uniref:Uncharacterized protein n=1 Tax=Ixodes scapularis TaxID=6945 RepID=B7PU65_IXOSC|nr:conserved hypothetical protein [Ixodes scapularis]|eukprot:XP_002405572.1 conserved hypothetical protein [Ixodes scapularis]